MKTRINLSKLFNLTNCLVYFGAIGTIISLIAMINSEVYFPFLICISSTLSLYFIKILLCAIIDIYDAVVPRPPILNTPNEDNANSQEQ